jgi:hypothetical protein
MTHSARLEVRPRQRRADIAKIVMRDPQLVRELDQRGQAWRGLRTPSRKNAFAVRLLKKRVRNEGVGDLESRGREKSRCLRQGCDFKHQRSIRAARRAVSSSAKLLFGVVFAAFRHTGREPFQSRSHTCLPVNDNAGRGRVVLSPSRDRRALESRLAHEAPLPAECIDPFAQRPSWGTDPGVGNNAREDRGRRRAAEPIVTNRKFVVLSAGHK